MQIKNTNMHWGILSKLLHWLSAITIIGMFALGLWMTDLSLYDAWYKKGPDLHRSIGVLLCIATLFRLFWRSINPTPEAPANHKPWERKAAHLTHALLYLLLFLIFISGYLISTADGRAIHVFDWFELPATLQGLKNQEDIAGDIHLALAISLITLVVVHAAGALKHHVIDRDNTLRRMLGK